MRHEGRSMRALLLLAAAVLVLLAGGAHTLAPAHAQPSQVPLTVSYSVLDGGGTNAQDILTYVTGGSQATAVLSSIPTQFMVDSGSQWSVLTALNGSTSTERWVTSQDVSGIISAPYTDSFTYYHQFLMNFYFNVTNGGAGFSPPPVSYTSTGVATSSPADQSAWVDASSLYIYANELPGSTASERWALSPTEPDFAGVVAGPGSVSTTYYHQFAVTSSYTIDNGGIPGLPVLAGFSFESPSSVPMTFLPQAVWFDSGSTASWSPTLAGGESDKGIERWVGTVQSGSGLSMVTNTTVVGPLTITPVYYHQYLVNVTFDYVGGGTTGLTLPAFSYQSFGSTASVQTKHDEWVDAGSPYTVPENICCPSSPAIERWVLNNDTSGSINFPTEINSTYFYQVMETFSFSVVGEQPLSPSSQPVLTYLLQGGAQHLTLLTTPQSFWADAGSAYSTESTLPGGTSSERWFASLATGVMAPPPSNNILVAYGQQYLLTFIGGGLQTQWVNAGTNSTLQAPGVFGREEGTGQRVVSYNIDSGNKVDVSPSYELAIPISMEGPHTITFQTVPQFEVTIEGAASDSLLSATPPTIPNDNYWYDQGSAVQITLSGVWGRADGVGQRITSITATNEGTTQVDVLGQVEAYSTASIDTPVSINVASVTQYEVVLNQAAQSAFVSVSPPSSLPTDTFWYDSGSQPVTIVLNGVFARSAGTGQRLSSWVLDSSQTNEVSSTGKVTVVTKAMTSPQFVNATVVSQYEVTLDKGGSTMLSSMTGPTIQQDVGWYDASTPVGVVMNGVLDRASGTGLRLAAYSLNGGADTAVASTGLVQVLDLAGISSPEAVQTSVVTQYQVTLDSGATGALSSITPTPIPQDKYWYDGGTPVTVTLNGEWGRTSTAGTRLSSYSVNKGASTPVLSASPVQVLALSAIDGPQSITTKTTIQYHLSSPFAPTSLTNSTIPGDAPGWFDSGTAVKAAYSLVWNETSGSRNMVMSYAIDNGAKTNVPASGPSTFTVSLTMSQAHTVTVTSVTQYLLEAAGPDKVTATPPSPTNDSYFDSGAKEAFTVPRMWNLTTEAGARDVLTSYSIDGAPAVAVPPSNSSTTFTTPTITFTGPQAIVFGTVPQYEVGFNFFDSVGAVPVDPSLVEIGLGNSTVDVQGSSTWLANGTSFRLLGITWEGASVGPATAPSYVVKASPLNVTLDTQVYEASLKVVDLFGLPVSGAKVAVTLDNGSVLTGTTNGQGRFVMGMIPLGTYTAKVSSLGMTSRVVGDSARQSVTQSKVLFSLISLLAVVGAAAGAAAAGFVFVRKMRRSKKAGGQVSAQK